MMFRIFSISLFLMAACTNSQSGSASPQSPSSDISKDATHSGFVLRHALKSSHPSYEGLVMTGYQGWFNTPDDGAGRDWNHYEKGQTFMPGTCSIDAWPDVSEYEVTYESPFYFADGSVARLFSSYDRSTTFLHFEWMCKYGIDGAFMQRFVQTIKNEKGKLHTDVVLDNALDAAVAYNRAICIMYDLSGMNAEDADRVIEDWKYLVDEMKVTSRPSNPYLYHRGRPLVAVWGVGFGDGRNYGYDEIRRLLDFFKNDPTYGGCSVLLGVPARWRELGADTDADPQLHEVIRQCDLVLPWLVGRYSSETVFRNNFCPIIAGDLAWCQSEGIDYVPVVWPGFSWYNLKYPELETATLNQIPRDEGRFFWAQISENIRMGARMLYYAMFDEIDEGTAIFKITNDPPVGASPFIDNDGMPSDWYLRLSGAGGRMLRQEIPFSETIPITVD